MESCEVTIINKLGLHARAAAKFVATAGHFACDIEVEKGDKKVNGKSIMGIMMLGATKGTQLKLVASGDDETQAIKGLSDLINDKFGEGE